MKKNSKCKKEHPINKELELALSQEKKEKHCQCDSTCDCGCNEGKTCSCSSGASKHHHHESCCCSSSHSSAPVCLFALLSSLIVSASILFTGLTISESRLSSTSSSALTPETLSLGVIKTIQENPVIVYDAVESHKQKVEAEQKAKAEAERIQREKEQAEKLATYTQSITADASNYPLGNKDGKYVIIEFFDYRCGWCKRTNSAIMEKISSGKAPNIRWILIDAPIFGEPSALISRYVLAAGKQGKFKEMHEAVMQHKGNATKDALINMGKELGLDTDKLTQDSESADIKAKIEANKKMAQEIGVQGVPFLIVNGKPHGGALINESLENAIEESNK